MQLRLLRNEPEEPSRSAEVPQHEWDEAFELFWKVVWRRVGRHPSLQAWRRLRPRTQATFDAIMDGVDRCKKVYEAREPEHRPHPLTWIRQQRWLDEDV
jgi:hypothetical protein